MYRAVAEATNAAGECLHRSTHDSNGDACQELADQYQLTPSEHETLWRQLSFEKDGIVLGVGEDEEATRWSKLRRRISARRHMIVPK